MKDLFLRRMRLTYYYPMFFIIFLVLLLLVPAVPLNSGQLALFTVNSFLLAFYLGPILGGQKQRVDDIAKVVRAESINLFSLAIQAQGLQKTTKDKIKNMVRKYLLTLTKKHRPVSGEDEYETLLRFTIDFQGKDADQIKKIQELLIKNEENRTQLAMLLRSAVFSHEWFVILVLTTISLAYIALIDYGDGLLLNIVAALLCTGLSLLLVILAKLSTLTHKKAKIIWKPYERLLATDFKHIDQ